MPTFFLTSKFSTRVEQTNVTFSPVSVSGLSGPPGALYIRLKLVTFIVGLYKIGTTQSDKTHGVLLADMKD